jgi:hypothetical protein
MASHKEIAAALGLDIWQVHQYCSPGRKLFFPTEIECFRVRLMAHTSQARLLEYWHRKTGVTKASILGWKVDLSDPQAVERAWKKREYDIAERQEKDAEYAARRLSESATVRQIAEELGKSHAYISRILKARGLVIPAWWENKEHDAARYGEARAANAIKQKAKALRVSTPKPKPMTPGEKFKKRYHTDIQFRIVQVLRSRLRKVARRGRGYGGNNLAWLGCTPKQLIAHLEAQFIEGMTWANYGSQWHIDHDKPCASFDMTIKEQRDECFHYTNLKPLLAGINLSKGSLWKGARYRGGLPAKLEIVKVS